MKNITKIDGFTLIEILSAIAIIGILSSAIYGVNNINWNFWHYNREKINLQQQARIISTYLEKDIKRSSKAESNNGELKLRFAEEGNLEYENYCKYNVNNDILVKIFPEDVNDDGIIELNDNWPDSWGYNRNISDNIIENVDYVVDNDNKLVTYTIELEKNNHRFVLKNKIYQRLPD